MPEITWRAVVDALYPEWDEEKEGAERLAGFLQSLGVAPPGTLPGPWADISV